MDDHDVYPPEMPDRPSSPILPLDDNTAERLLANRLDPDDAPPAYGPVARLLRAAAAPPCPDQLAGQPAALAAFRAARPGPAGSAGPAAGVRGRPARAPGRPARAAGRPGRAVRRRLVAAALAGALVVGGAAAGVAATGGLWTADAIPSLGRLRSPTGGPGTGGPGSSVPGVGSDGAVAGGSGSGGAGGVRRVPAVDDSEAKAGKAKARKAKEPKGGKPEGGKPKDGKPKKPTKPTSDGPKAAAQQGGNGRGHAGERE